jgi:hypothetical protein
MKNNTLKIEYIIFQCIKVLIAFFKKHHCKISRIEKNIELVDYLITFNYTNKRQIFVKPVTEIYKNSYLLNAFAPEDVAIIGFYYTMIHLEKLAKVKNYEF